MDDTIVARADALRAYLEPLVAQADSSQDPSVIAVTCDAAREALAELMPHQELSIVNDFLLFAMRWYILLSIKRAEPPWLDIGILGVAFSAFHVNLLEMRTASLHDPEASEAQQRASADSAYQLMVASRSVIDIAAYAYHRCGLPALAGQLVEDVAGSLFEAERSLTAVRAVSEGREQQLELMDQHFDYFQSYDSEALPVVNGMSLDEANALYVDFFRKQIARVMALPRHLHLRAASRLYCAPQIAAIESGRDVVYLVATPSGSAAIRYQHLHNCAPETLSVELHGVRQEQVSNWVYNFKTAYNLYCDRLIVGRDLDHVLTRVLYEIGAQIVSPIFATWPQIRRFVLIPVGDLSALPFYTALVDGQPACTVRDFTVAPSAQTLHASAMFSHSTPLPRLLYRILLKARIT